MSATAGPTTHHHSNQPHDALDESSPMTVETVVPARSSTPEPLLTRANRTPDEGLECPATTTVETVEPSPVRTVPIVDSPAHRSAESTESESTTDPYAPGGPWAYAEKKHGRAFKITTQWTHPDTGEVLITPAHAEQTLSRKGNLRTAWINHNRDTVIAADVSRNSGLTLGQLKRPHLHAVEERRNQTSVGQVARAWGLSPSFVEVLKGHGAFLDACEYLTHEHDAQQAEGKYLYNDSDVKANFNFREQLDGHIAKRTRTDDADNRKMSAVDRLAMMVQNDGLTLTEAEAYDALAYNRGEPRLVRARATYLSKLPQPSYRMNIYLYGEGGTGKDALARAMARQMVPGDWIPGVREPFFVLGGDNVAWEGYDGEPVVIIEEARAGGLIKSFGRKELFAFLNPFPAKQKLNIKNSSVLPVNTITIMTGPDNFETFLDGLAGEYTDKSGTQFKAENKNQSYRRFPMIIPVRDDEFDLMVNKGFVDNTSEYREYYSYRGIRQNMRQVLRRVKGIEDPHRRAETQLEIEAKQVGPILDQHDIIKAAISTEQEDPDTLLTEFADLGEIVTDEERAARQQERLRRARTQADGVTASSIAAGRPKLAHVSERGALPPVIYVGGRPDMSLWDVSTGTYNGQQPLNYTDISAEFRFRG